MHYDSVRVALEGTTQHKKENFAKLGAKFCRLSRSGLWSKVFARSAILVVLLLVFLEKVSSIVLHTVLAG